MDRTAKICWTVGRFTLLRPNTPARSSPGQSAVCDELSALRVLHRARSKRRESGQIRVNVEASGPCHTDIPVRTAPVKPEPPFVPGHEGVGIVCELGSGLTETAIVGSGPTSARSSGCTPRARCTGRRRDIDRRLASARCRVATSHQRRCSRAERPRRPFGARGGRLAASFERAADALERAAEQADKHAERETLRVAPTWLRSSTNMPHAPGEPLELVALLLNAGGSGAGRMENAGDVRHCRCRRSSRDRAASVD
jgi:hypothetical protein